MIKDDRQLGRPFVDYKDTKANIEALTGVEEGARAYATDTDQQGFYNGAAWVWGTNLFNDSEGDPADVGASASDGTSSYAARRDHVHKGSASGAGQVLGISRWASGGGTTFDLPDVAESILDASDNGSIVDPLTYSLSSDRSQIVFDSAIAAGHVVTSKFVIAQV